MMHTIYTGKRVRLRPFASADEFVTLDDKFMAVPSTYWGPNWRPRAERAAEFDATGLIDAMQYSAFAVERLDTGELIGLEEFGGVSPGRLYTWLGTFILDSHQRQGFGIEAKQLMLCYLFENLPLETVHAVTTSSHTRARAGLEASGMSLIGRKHRVLLVAGKRYDEVCYQISRAEWEQLPIRQVVKRGA